LTIVRRDLGNVLVAERVRDPLQFGLNVIGRAFGQLGLPVFLVCRYVDRDRIIRSTSPLRFFWKAMAGSLPAAKSSAAFRCAAAWMGSQVRSLHRPPHEINDSARLAKIR
jgi:hypothetical protein